jgi:hypothetical protein
VRGFESRCRIELVVLNEPSSPWNLLDVSIGERQSGLDNVEVDVDWAAFLFTAAGVMILLTEKCASAASTCSGVMVVPQFLDGGWGV